MRNASTIAAIGCHALIALAACGGAARPTTPADPIPAPAPATAVVPLPWAVGTYAGEAGNAGPGQLAVRDVEGATYAIWLGERDVRVWIVDEAARDQPALAAWSAAGIPDAPAVTELPGLQAGAKVAVFGDAEGRSLLTLRRTATGGLVVSEAGTAAPFVTGELVATAAAPATALEDADRAFAAASKARGADAWAETVAEHGVLYRRQGLVAGPAAVRETMAKPLAEATVLWEPVASGINPAGTLGFTVGRARWMGRGNEPVGAGSYVTIWQRQPDGTWKWVFDAGRPR